MGILTKIKGLAEAAAPSYRFEYEAARMQNVKADDGAFPLIFFEEYVNKDGAYVARYGWRRRQSVELYFLRLAPMQADALTREAVRERIEREAVLPFIEALDASREFEAVGDIRVTAVPPMFDSNAVGLLLSFDVTFPACSLTEDAG